MSDEPVVTTINRGGRPRKYHTEEQRKEGLKRAKEKHRLAKLTTPLPEIEPDPVLPETTDLQAAILKACVGLDLQATTFVTAVCSGQTLAAAYKRARPEVSDASVSTAGPRYAARPEIAKAIAAVKAALALNVAYDFNRFMREMDQAMVFAKQTRNATAYVRAVELRGKSTGHLADKPQAGGSGGFTLVIGGIDSPLATAERIDD